MQLPIGSAFLGARAQRLVDVIAQQGGEFLQAGGIDVPVRAVSTLLYIHHSGPSSLVQIAKAQHESHQLTAQRISLLQQLSMLAGRVDAKDRRRRLFELTNKGKRQAVRVEARCAEAATVFEDLNGELSVDLGRVLDAAFVALVEKPMLSRVDGGGSAVTKSERGPGR